MKRCPRCGQEKPLSKFYNNTKSKDGRSSYCKECHTSYYKEKIKSPEYSEKQRLYMMKHRYGLSPEQYGAMMEQQNFCCAICKEEFGDGGRKPCVDHDHNCCPGTKTCGKCVRAILCNTCNVFTGLVETRFHTMDDMFRYLTHHLIKEKSEVK